MQNKGAHKSIMVIDDDLDIREALSAVLESSGFPTITASGGREAFTFLNDQNAVKPSLILLDLMMPDMDGFEFMRQRDLSRDFLDIPVVLISASGDLGPKVDKLKAEAYLKKPLGIAELLSISERYCG